eukprot:Em0021g753a
MSDWDIASQVAKLLKECYPDHPEMGQYKITHHKKPLTTLVEDPLLWVRLSHKEQQANAIGSYKPDIKGAIHPNCLKKRMEVLKEALKQTPNIAKLTSDEKRMEELFAGYLGNAIISAVDTQLSSNECPDDSPTLDGVITEFWISGGEWSGAVTSIPTTKNGQIIVPAKGYQFDSTSPVVVDSQLVPYPLHIGDEVSFSPAIIDHSVACCSLRVTKYNTCLKEAFVLQYLGWLLELKHRPLDCLSTLLSWPAPWVCAINEDVLYSHFYAQILTIYDICTSSSEVTLVERDKHDLIALFSGSQFTLNIAKVLSDNIDTVENILPIAVRFLCDAVRVKSDNNYLLANPIKSMGQVLARMQKVDLMQCLVVSVVDTHCVPTAPVEATPLTWQHLPTIPTSKEFKEIVSIFERPKPKFALPTVKATYSSALEYGHTCFSLLRADCYYPLCEKIARLKARSGKVEDSYYQMNFTELVSSSPKPVLFGFRFKGIISNIPQADDPPCLMHGNLLCISMDGKFEEELVWATVEYLSEITTVEGEQGKLTKEGSVHVQLCSDFNTLPDEECMEQLRRSKDILAVESPAYFRAYQPVLRALKELDLSRLHFLEDFLSPAFSKRDESGLTSLEVDPGPLFKPDKNDGLGKRKIADLKMIDPLALCLDSSQMEAIYKSLAMAVSVIQGPPGTGKTYVGVKLMQLFLSLSSLPKDKPILIMAYRNKALDHFLETCLQFGVEAGDIVRVGSYHSTDCEALQHLLLNTKARSKETKRSKNLRRQLQSLNKKIIEASRNVIVRSKFSLENCREYMTKEWLQSLLLKGPQNLSEDVKDHLKTYPDKCLELILKGEAMMGESQMKKQKELNEALKCAWDQWAKIVQTGSGEESNTKQQQNGIIEEQGDEDEIRHGEDSERRQEFYEYESQSRDTIQFEDVNVGYFNDTETQISCRDVWALCDDDKRKLVVQAVKKGYTVAMECLKGYLKQYKNLHQKFETEQRKLQLDVLRHSKIVGMTTSGAAINQQLLNELQASVVFVEEAAEVLESNLLASLTPSVKHLILIGDHMQLKPKVACNHLKNYKFETSLFQRLVEGGFSHSLLIYQNRMRPEMVRLYAHHYREQKRQSNTDTLQSNMEAVKNIAQLSCMATSVFWWDHKELETRSGGGQIINNHEVKMVVSLCLWILSNSDLGVGDITILTPYRAQMKAIEKALKDKSNYLSGNQVPHNITTCLSQLKVCTVDEFQGHESKVIILSLVRNNVKEKIGFLSDKHRLVVAVSRQKCGLYIVGSAKCLSKSSPVLWKSFIEHRVDHKEIGEDIILKADLKCSTPKELEELVCRQKSRSTYEADSPMKTQPTMETTPSKPPIRQQSSPAMLSSPQEGPPRENNPEGPPGETNPELNLIVSTDCMIEVSKSVKKWKFLARRLKLEENEISNIEKDRQADGQDEMCCQVLIKWKQEQSDQATYRNLIRVLESERLNDLVASVKSQALNEKLKLDKE